PAPRTESAPRSAFPLASRHWQAPELWHHLDMAHTEAHRAKDQKRNIPGRELVRGHSTNLLAGFELAELYGDAQTAIAKRIPVGHGQPTFQPALFGSTRGRRQCCRYGSFFSCSRQTDLGLHDLGSADQSDYQNCKYQRRECKLDNCLASSALHQ